MDFVWNVLHDCQGKKKNPQNFGDVLMVDSDGGYFLFLNNI